MKWLLWALLLGGAIWLLRGARVRSETPAGQPRGPQPSPAGAAQPPAKGGSREIVPCAHCGVHLPRDEAVTGPDGRTLFCSESHRIEQARQRGGQPAR